MQNAFTNLAQVLLRRIALPSNDPVATRDIGYRSTVMSVLDKLLAAENPSVKQDRNRRFDLCLYLFSVRS
jgi:hypothetical protein